MTERNDGGPARLGEIGHRTEERGVVNIEPMSLRDYFAAQALIFLQGYQPAQPDKHKLGNPLVLDTDEVARASYEIADSMLKARDQ